MKQQVGFLMLSISLAAWPVAGSSEGKPSGTSELKVGPWIVTSSDSNRDENGGAELTHFNVFLNSNGERLHRGSFTGSSDGDGGERQETNYYFTLSTGQALQVEEVVGNFEPVWELDPSGGIGFQEDETRILLWDGQEFATVATSSTLTISPGPVDVIVSGTVFHDAQGPGKHLSKQPGKIIGAIRRQGGKAFKVKLQSGVDVFALPEAVRGAGIESDNFRRSDAR